MAAAATDGSSCQPLEQARELLWMLGRLHSHIEFELDSSLAESARWPVEEQDFSELLGNQPRR